MRAAVAVAVGAMALCAMASTAGERAEPRTHTVTIADMRFTPDTLTVSPGDTVIWVNKDLVPHTATSEPGGFDSKSIAANQSWEYTPRRKGAFTYICAFHPTMTATLRVR